MISFSSFFFKYISVCACVYTVIYVYLNHLIIIPQTSKEKLIKILCFSRSKAFSFSTTTTKKTKRIMTSILARQFWSNVGSFLRPTVQIQPSVRTKMVRRINRHRVPTHAKPSDKWAQNKSV